ncbi:MAG: hypothetical protein JXR12_15250 [Neptunomonas phycophila]|uniref:hypothetical protein n=1 Tax=Neptunomonas phycophila TaxID=1572645 RepID=UPI003B8B5F8E
MYKILNELSGIDSQLPPEAEDEKPEQNSEVEVYRIDDPDEGDCGCDGEDPDSCECDDAPAEDPVEDLVNRFRDWLTSNVDVEHMADAEPEESPEDESFENEEPIDPEMEMGEEPVEGPEEVTPDMEMGGEEGDLGSGPDELEDPNKQGMIRVVKGAHLVYKRKTPDGYYEELWMFNIGKESARDEMEIRKEILSGTEIPETGTRSEDGSQSYDLWTSGNGQMMKITGLPN